MLLALIWETCSTDQKHETGRLKHARTEENVITVDKMVGLLNHKGQKQTYCSIRQISKEKDLTKCSIVQIIHDIFVQKCILFTNTFAVYFVSFSWNYVSHGNVGTQLTRGKIFNIHFIANCSQNAPVNKLQKSVNFYEDINNHKVERFFIGT